MGLESIKVIGTQEQGGRIERTNNLLGSLMDSTFYDMIQWIENSRADYRINYR